MPGGWCVALVEKVVESRVESVGWCVALVEKVVESRVEFVLCQEDGV